MLGDSEPTGGNHPNPADGREVESTPKLGGRKQALRFLVAVIVNTVFLTLVLYLVGLLARRHTTESFFRGVADDWKTVVPMLFVFGVGFTLWNRWLRRRRLEKRRKMDGDGDGAGLPVD